MPLIIALRRQRQADLCEMETSLRQVIMEPAFLHGHRS